MESVDVWEECGDRGATGSSLSMEQPENEIVNESPRESVMTVEFAIKRELAYRMRMEKLQLKPSGNVKIKEAPTRYQGLLPTPNSGVLGMKRKASSSNLYCFPQSQQAHNSQPLQNQSVNLFYEVGQVARSSPANFNQHGESSKQKAKLKEFVESRNRKLCGKNPVWCKLCEIPCSCEISLAQHLSGKKHAARVQAVEFAKRSRDEAEKEALKFKWDEMEWEMVA